MERSDLHANLEQRARRVYETALLRRAIWRSWPVPVLAVLAARLGTSEIWVAVLAVTLLFATVGFLWRGGAYGHGVAPGLVAGGAPLVLPSLAYSCAVACSASCSLWCSIFCVAGGILAGALVGFRAVRFGEGWSRFLCSGAVIAAITGAMGCLLGGFIGVTGMAAGFVLGAAPTLLLVPRHA